MCIFQAQQILSGTVSKDKNEILFNEYGINYNNELTMFRKGTTLIRKLIPNDTNDTNNPYVIKLNCDIISDAFWMENWEILGLESLRVYDKPVDITGYRVTNSHVIEREEPKRLEIVSE